MHHFVFVFDHRLAQSTRDDVLQDQSRAVAILFVRFVDSFHLSNTHASDSYGSWSQLPIIAGGEFHAEAWHPMMQGAQTSRGGLPRHGVFRRTARHAFSRKQAVRASASIYGKARHSRQCRTGTPVETPLCAQAVPCREGFLNIFSLYRGESIYGVSWLETVYVPYRYAAPLPRSPPLPCYYLLPTTYYLLPTTYYLLPTTYYLLPTTYYLLPTTYYLLPTTYYLLPATCYLLPTTYYLLPTTYYST